MYRGGEKNNYDDDLKFYFFFSGLIILHISFFTFIYNLKRSSGPPPCGSAPHHSQKQIRFTETVNLFLGLSYKSIVSNLLIEERFSSPPTGTSGEVWRSRSSGRPGSPSTCLTVRSRLPVFLFTLKRGVFQGDRGQRGAIGETGPRGAAVRVGSEDTFRNDLSLTGTDLTSCLFLCRGIWVHLGSEEYQDPKENL